MPFPTLDALAKHQRGRRNDRWIDIWSAAHLLSGIALGWVMEPFVALVLLILWEPLEIFVLSPLAWHFWKVEFGYESWRNSLSDILFDAAGVALGAWVLTLLWDPPFTLL